MFNPKGNNLLDEQMFVSGLEMNLDPLTGLAIANTGFNIIKGITGSQQASSQNAAAEKAYKEQQEAAEEVAKATNKYNKEVFEAQVKDYNAMRDYSQDQSLKNWERGAEIQDFQYLNQLKQWQKSTAIGNAQLGLNAQAASQGIQAEQDAIQEAFIQQQFQHRQSKDALKQTYVEQNINRQEQFQKIQGIRSRQAFGNVGFQNTIDQLMTQGALAKEAEMVKNLVAEGSIQAAGQAGRSTAKSLQSNMAGLHRGLMVLESELSGKYKQAAVQMAELNADSSLQEAGVGLNLQRIDAAIKNAESDAQFNLEVMRENMKSTLNQTLRDVKQIGLERQVADLNTKAGMMLFPERLSYERRPEPPPERTFIEPMEVKPGYTAPPQQVSTFAPLISGIGAGVSALAGINWGGSNISGGGASGGSYGSNIQIGTGTNYFN